MSVEDKDLGWSALRKRIDALAVSGGAYVTVGVQGPKATAQHQDSELTVAEVATIHEFGATVTLPSGAVVKIAERSFIRAGVDAFERRLQRTATALGRGMLLGKFTRGQALGLLGEEAVGLIKGRIVDGIPPPNAPATIAAKGSSTPLIDKSQLIGSITYEVGGGS